MDDFRQKVEAILLRYAYEDKKIVGLSMKTGEYSISQSLLDEIVKARSAIMEKKHVEKWSLRVGDQYIHAPNEATYTPIVEDRNPYLRTQFSEGAVKVRQKIIVSLSSDTSKGDNLGCIALDDNTTYYVYRG